MVSRHQTLPAWVLDEPAIDPCERIYLMGFADLSSCRQIGMSLGPIPWRDIADYADRKGLEDEAHELFCAAIREMDVTFLEEWVPKNSKTPETQAPAETANAG